ncbi:MAG: hypothetical protein M3065_16835 [Actinomycetota bacterium]|nr:hypothetical protein [Actinomycetota bacterium]
MFERFTDQARQVVVLAQDTARELKHDYIGTENLLLGLLRQGDGVAAGVLGSLDVTLERVREHVVRIVGASEEVPDGQIPFTPRAKKVLELSLRESLSLGHNYIRPEHILLAMARENNGIGARILLDFAVDAEKIRNEVVRLLAMSEQPAASIAEQRSGMVDQVVQLAQVQARELKHNQLGTADLLLGLLGQEEGIAARVLASLDVTFERVRAQVVRIVGVGEEDSPSQVPFTPRAKKVLELSVREALSLGHNYIGPELILLGIAREDTGAASRILLDFDVDAEKLRHEVVRLLADSRPQPQPAVSIPRQVSIPREVSGFDPSVRVRLAASLRRSLMLAAARALDDGRSEIDARDVLLALTHDEKAGPLLAGLGVDAAAVSEVIERDGASDEPPETAAGG